MFVIHDELHDESVGQFTSFSDAVAEVRRVAALPWDQEPNLAPCTNWRVCGRNYEIVELNDSARPWLELSRVPIASVTERGVVWATGGAPSDQS